MHFKYIEDIKCFRCGGKELEKEHILSGFIRCTCKICGAKFLAQCEGSDIVDRYIADRGRITAVMETSFLEDGALNEAKSGLKTLVNSYSAIVEIDPVYHWYKIILLTNNFRDYSQFEEAEREYRKVSESYFVDATDKTRADGYEKMYDAYCREYAKQKKKKKKLILSFSLAGFVAAVLIAFLCLFFYNPVLKDGRTGVSVKLNNSSYGIFNKFSVTMAVDGIDEGTPKYNVVDAAINELAVKYEVYEINLYKNGTVANPDSPVPVTIPLPSGYNKECISVYSIDNSGTYEEVSGVVVSGGNVEFNAMKSDMYAVAERKLKVTFDSVNGEEPEVQTLEWGNSVPEPAEPAARFGYVFGGWYQGDKKYNFSLAVAQDLVLTAHWVRDSKYDGYTYISTAQELADISLNTSGRYLIINDIDLGGAVWTVIDSFKGTLDGGCHAIYNFSVTSSAKYSDVDRVMGLFGQLLKGSTVKNLQVGKEGTTTKFECLPWQQNVHMGAVAGYSAGEITNCRVIGCTMNSYVSAQENIYTGAEFASNVGGVCGVVRAGSVTRCYVSNCNFSSNSWSKFNHINNSARCGGIVGFADNSGVSDCLIENNALTSKSQTMDSAQGNPAGQPYTAIGGVIGHAANTTIERVVVFNNTLTANKIVGNYSDGSGATYCGCMMGFTSSTKPGSLIGVNTTQNCSGSNNDYSGFTVIARNSFELLTETDEGFNNGFWTDNDGAIALPFDID